MRVCNGVLAFRHLNIRIHILIFCKLTIHHNRKTKSKFKFSLLHMNIYVYSYCKKGMRFKHIE
jgi:hypothetical protein